MPKYTSPKSSASATSATQKTVLQKDQTQAADRMSERGMLSLVEERIKENGVKPLSIDDTGSAEDESIATSAVQYVKEVIDENGVKIPMNRYWLRITKETSEAFVFDYLSGTVKVSKLLVRIVAGLEKYLDKEVKYDIDPDNELVTFYEFREDAEGDLITTRKARRPPQNFCNIDAKWELQKKLWRNNKSVTYYFPLQKYEKKITGTVMVCKVLVSLVKELKDYEGKTVKFTISETNEYDAIMNGKTTMGVVSFYKPEPKYFTTLISGPSGSGKTSLVNGFDCPTLHYDQRNPVRDR